MSILRESIGFILSVRSILTVYRRQWTLPSLLVLLPLLVAACATTPSPRQIPTTQATISGPKSSVPGSASDTPSSQSPGGGSGSVGRGIVSQPCPSPWGCRSPRPGCADCPPIPSPFPSEIFRPFPGGIGGSGIGGSGGIGGGSGGIGGGRW